MQPSLKDSCIPHQENNYLPTLLRRSALLGMLGLVLLSFLGANLQALLWQSSTWLTGAVLPSVVVEKTNVERSGEALPALVRNPILDAAAQLKADDMAKNSYFAHYSPKGVSPWHWFNEAGYSFVHAGENLAVHFSDSREVVDAWMNSPTHRANIVNGNYREIGVGTARGTYQGYDTVFVVQLFGAPALPAVPAAATPELPSIAVRPDTTSVETLAIVTTREDSSDASGQNSVEAVAGAEIMTVRESSLAPESSPVRVNRNLVARVVEREIYVPPAPSVVEKTVVDESMISVYSTFAATSTNLTPAPLGVLTAATSGTTPFLASLATQPSQVLQFLYLGLGGLVAVLLFMAVGIEWKRQHPRQVVYGVLLLLLMSGLFYLHMVVTSGAVIV